MSTTFVSLQRLSLFKSLQDALNARTYLGKSDTAVAAQKLETAVNIDGISFDGSESITLPTKIVQIYSQTDPGTGDISYFEDSGFTTAITTFDTSKLYVDMTTGQIKYFNGTALVASVARDTTPYIPLSAKGTSNGVAELDGTGKVPAAQLPSYVDDVIEGYVTDNAGTISFYEDAAKTTVITGETGKIYVDVEATVDGSYRWSGSNFIKIGSSVSTADRAVHDGNGDVISSTYMKTADYVDATEAEIRALFNEGSGGGTGGGTGGGE